MMDEIDGVVNRYSKNNRPKISKKAKDPEKRSLLASTYRHSAQELSVVGDVKKI